MPPAATNPQERLQEAIAAHRRGRTDWALELAGRVRKLGGKAAVEASVVMAEALFRAGRLDELRALLETPGDFQSDRRWKLMSARHLRASGGDAAAVETLLRSVLDLNADDHVHRMAAFELVRVLEKAGRYDEAWDTAADTHRRTTRPFDTDALVRALAVTAGLARQNRLADLPRATTRIERTALVTGLPRSGTTLVEQMLDRHPRIRGVGEVSVHGRMADALAHAGGGWPAGALVAAPALCNQWQQTYRKEVRSLLEIPGGVWTLDKTLFPMVQPLALAAVLPGARTITLTREARDNATSLFLSNFDPTWGWTGSLDSIRRVIAAHRRHVPVIVEALRVADLPVRYEQMVEAPEPAVRAMLAHLGLEPDDNCLHPEDNRRVVHTLSHEQVRRPINRESIGRWQRYAARFDSAWDELADTPA
ncbi:MAG: sulfotransferase [Phycisphaeraceae bacterium]|nr:sulfotransferase [Phycisphaeraceae bacterium]